MSARLGPPSGSLRQPWFRRRPALALAVATALFVAVLVLRLTDGSSAEPYSMLYALPVALLATAFGLRAGAGAGLLAVGLIALWTVVDDVSLSAAGWASRAVPILLLGVLLGQAADRVRTVEGERRRLERAALLHREAIEINDSLVQGMAAAKWSLEAGQVETALRLLDQTISNGHELVSGLIRRADMGSHAEVVRTREDRAG
jgi:hypothetical protein